MMMTRRALLGTIAAAQIMLFTSILPANSQVVYVQPHHEGFFHRHPYAAAAGVGALTGGVGGLFLGAGLLHGAAIGAGTHSGFHWLKQKWEAHRYRAYY